ncbi:RNA polymerase II-associated 1 [Lecanosticta acicola]|uniref:RNA polymerase II-associated 1 n=1 Tax=Lecanosticta acicola TaxID=111012 RepID=A0AAI9E7L6_9PEZI|nr:RNA polymerase II-associated 1 [Lecanosticta acicola]
MASSQQKVVHQDYIARIRYSNALPPPPNPPKLLDIPGTGLSGGQYTSAGYASRLAREQPLNIEADAELGMPIDLIGIPGIFDGDERAISTRSGPQTLHPADKALLKPVAALGKPNAGGAVSFLRRTEYTASQSTQHFTSSTSKDLVKLRNDGKKRKPSVNKEDPINIMRNIIKGFDIAYPKDVYRGEDSTTNLRGAPATDQEAKAWSNPRHPSKPDLKLLDSYPILPDLDAIPSTGFYMVMRFNGNPVDKSRKYDERLDTAILRPVTNEDGEAAYLDKQAAWEESDQKKPAPIREYDYDYFLPEDASAPRGIKRKLNVNDPENDDSELYTDDLGNGRRAFKYTRLRTYETRAQEGDPNEFYNSTVAVALHDPETDVGTTPGAKKRLQKGAYFYPVVQRTSLRPKRNVGKALYQDEEPKVDEIDVTIGDMNEDTQANQLERKAQLDPNLRSTAEG